MSTPIHQSWEDFGTVVLRIISGAMQNERLHEESLALRIISGAMQNERLHEESLASAGAFGRSWRKRHMPLYPLGNSRTRIRMKPFDTIEGRELTWTQNKAADNSFELLAAGESVASISWEKGLASEGAGATSDQSWTFKREGFFRPRVQICAAGSSDVLGTLEFAWTGSGSLKLKSGATYRWDQRSFWGGVWSFSSDSGKEIVSFKLDRGLTRTASVLNVTSDQDKPSDLALLCVLGWYVLVLYSEDAIPVGV